MPWGQERRRQSSISRLLSSRRAILVAIVLLAAVVVIASSIFLLPKLLVSWDLGEKRSGLTSRELAETTNDIRATLLQGLVVTALLIGAFLTWRQLQVSKEGQVTERFTRAIEQLGSEKLDVRLGAIFALERIAKDSSTDLGAVVEVLSAYIREHSPWPPRNIESPSWQEPGQAPLSEMQEFPTLRVRAADIQAALTVLAQRLAISAEFVNLSATDLRRANLRFASFGRASFWGSNLQGARVHSANFAEVLLNMADFRDARADKWTIWPEGFDWKGFDVIVEETGDYP